MTTSALGTEHVSWLHRLAYLEGAWIGDVMSADGSVVGRQQLSCTWDPQQDAFRLKSCRVSRVGRVLDAEEAVITYDPVTDSLVALFRQGARWTELARAYINRGDEMVLVSDSDLRLRRLCWSDAGPDPPAATRTWTYRVEVEKEDRLHAEVQVVLRRAQQAK
jgi:hypothetical protein